MMRERGEVVTTFNGPDGIRRVFAIAAMRDRTGAVVAFATVGIPEEESFGACSTRPRAANG